MNLTVKPLPSVNTIPDITICNTQTITLTTVGNATTYSWNPTIQLSDPNSPSPQFFGSPGHKYYVTGTLNGCTNIDSVTITVSTAATTFVQPPSKSFCAGQSVTLDGYNGNNVTYLWTGNNLSNIHIKDPVASPQQNTVYSVIITDTQCNFDSTFLVSVNVLPLPLIKAQKSNDINCAYSSAVLNVSGGLAYIWSPSQTLSSAVIPNPIATPAVTTTYYVTGTGANGCSNRDIITVYKGGGEGNINIPNSFSPNGDGKNDCFKILYTGQLYEYSLSIYNRWGEPVFESHNINDCWDGKYKGANASVGGYVYYISAKNLCGTIQQKGNLLLIR